MKLPSKILAYMVLALLFTSCAISPVLTSTPTETLQPTLASTETPTQTPTITPTATETGPIVGNQKTENGLTYTYTYVPESGYYGWVRPAGQIPFYPWQSLYAPTGTANNESYTSSSPLNDVGPTTLLIDIRIDEATVAEGKPLISSLTHIDQPAKDTNVRFNQDIDAYLYNKDDYPNSPDPGYQFILDLQNGFKIPYYLNGKPYTTILSTQSGATIYVLPYDDSDKPSPTNGFWEWSDEPYNTQFRTAFWGVNQRGIMGAIATDIPFNELNPFEVRLISIWHEAVIVENANQDVKDVGFSGLAQRLATQAAQPRSLIDIQYQK